MKCTIKKREKWNTYIYIDSVCFIFIIEEPRPVENISARNNYTFKYININ
jgi:hypothetical protein